MPDLDTGTFAVLQSSRLLVKYLMPKYSDELDEIVDKYPQLGDALMKAIDWAPSMLRVVPPEDPNMFSMEAASDGDGDGDSESESLDGGPMSRGRISSGDPRISFTGGSSATYTTQPVLPRNAPQPGPSQEPQPGRTLSREKYRRESHVSPSNMSFPRGGFERMSKISPLLSRTFSSSSTGRHGPHATSST